MHEEFVLKEFSDSLHIIEVISRDSKKETVISKNPIESVFSVAGKFKNEGMYYIVYYDDTSYLVNIKNGELQSKKEITTPICSSKWFFEATLFNREYVKLKDIK